MHHAYNNAVCDLIIYDDLNESLKIIIEGIEMI